MSRWLSDRHRPLALAIALTLLAGFMGWWAGETGAGTIGSVGVLERPEGSDVVLSLLTVMSIDGPDRYVLGHAALHVPVAGSTAGLRTGEEVTVGGIVGDGVVVERWREDAPSRPLKRRLGVLGIGAAAVLLASSVRVGRTGLALRG